MHLTSENYDQESHDKEEIKNSHNKLQKQSHNG